MTISCRASSSADDGSLLSPSSSTLKRLVIVWSTAVSRASQMSIQTSRPRQRGCSSAPDSCGLERLLLVCTADFDF